MHIRKDILIPSVVGVASFGAGAAVGYFIAVKRFSDKVDEVVQRMNDLMADGEDLKVNENQISMDDLVVDYVMNDPTPAEVAHSGGFIIAEEDFVRTTVFRDVSDDWVMEDELAYRATLDPGEPYVIHREEFDEEEPGYSQVTLTFYAGDNILTDDKDVPLEHIGKIIGNCAEFFGKGSGDPNVVYVRNDRLNAEYEILLDRGFYAIEVLGEEIEQALSVEKKALLKFRPTD